MYKNKKTKLCPYSMEEFEAKRQNQIYATAECRIAHHNEKNNNLRKQLSYINKQLLLNYKIASEIIGMNPSTLVHSQFLRGKGFSFKMFTHFQETAEGYTIGLYDLCLEKIDENNYKIQRKND